MAKKPADPNKVSFDTGLFSMSAAKLQEHIMKLQRQTIKLQSILFTRRLAILDVGSKVLSILVLVFQAAFLDHFFIKFDVGDPRRWIWIGGDAVVLVIWIAGLVLCSRNVRSKKSAESPEQSPMKKCWNIVAFELQYAYLSWIVYSIVMVAKMWYMFGDFAKTFHINGYYNMTSDGEVFIDSDVYSSVALKLLLSLAGPLFLLLAYAHHDETHNSTYKLLMEKLETVGSLGVLDNLMLLAILFQQDTHLRLPFHLYRAIKFFTCGCFILPALPLFILRLISLRKTEENYFKLFLVINSALYLFLVNLPFLCIRFYLWFEYDVDISTFIIKNLMGLFRGFLDMYNEIRQWLKSRQGSVEVTTLPTERIDETEVLGLELADKSTEA